MDGLSVRFRLLLAVALMASPGVACAPPDSPGTPGAPDTTPPPPAGTLTLQVYFTRGEQPVPVTRVVPGRADVLNAAVEQLLQGPTPAEHAAGIASWFSAATAGMLKGATLDAVGHAIVDFHDFRLIIPGASSAAGSQALLGELNATVGQFTTVRTVEYRIEGSCDVFWNFLQRACQTVRLRG